MDSLYITIISDGPGRSEYRRFHAEDDERALGIAQTIAADVGCIVVGLYAARKIISLG